MIEKESLPSKLIRVLKRDGLFKIVKRIVLSPITKIKRKRFEENIYGSSREKVFSAIYKTNYWANEESISGNGSTLEYTKNTRQKLISIVHQFNINTIVDLCCGDFNWMSKTIDSMDVNYTGIDIVPSLIKNNNDKYTGSNLSFIVGDACKDIIPECDLLILRNSLFHFSFLDTNEVLSNLKNTTYKYLLTTTYMHENPKMNKDISTGAFRFIDLSVHPYNFKLSKSFFSVSEPSEGGFNRCMVLLEKNDVPDKLQGV